MSTRLALGLSVAVVGLTLGACGSDDKSGGSSDGGRASAPTGTVRIVLTADIQQAMENVGAEFERTHPNTNIQVEVVASDQLPAVERARIRSGSPPDLMQAAPGSQDAFGILTYAKEGVVTDLSDEPWVDTIPEIVGSTIKLDGKTYGFITSFGFSAAIYDRSVFAKLGFEIPKTYDELLALCHAATDKGKTAIALGGQDVFMNIFPGVALAASAVEPDFAQRRAADEVTFAESAGWLKSLEQFKEMADEGCFGESPTGYGFVDAQQQVAKGEALTLIGVPTFATPVRDANPRGDFGMFPLATSDDADSVRVPIGGTYGMVVPVKAKNPELAKEFLRFLAERDAQFAKDAQSLPAVGLETIADAPLLPGMEPMEPYLSDEHTVTWATLTWPNPEVQNQWITGIQAMLSGDGTTPQQILESMDKAWTSGS